MRPGGSERRPGFWTFFGAVLAALIAHDLLRLAVAAGGLSLALGLFQDKPPVGTTPGHLPARPDAVRASPAAPAALPYLQGPVSALRDGDPQACINGRVADRLENGWRQHHDQRCDQATP
jgi:hypothetical protein